MRRPALAAAPLAAALVVVLAACGGGDDESTASSVPSLGASEPAASPSTSAPAPAERTPGELFTALTAAQQAAGSSRFTVTTTGAGVEISGSGVSRTGADPAFDVTMSLPEQAGVPAGEVQMVLVGDALYFRLPGIEEDLGVPWVRASADGSDPLSQALAPAFDTLRRSATPDFGVYQAATLTPRGQEQVDGVDTTVYDMVVDVAAAAAAATGEQRTQLESLLAAGTPSLTGTIWVGADDLVRRFVTDVSVAGSTATSTVEFSGYGDPVDIVAPPADQVVDAADLE